MYVTGMNSAKTAEPIEMLFGMWARVVPSNYVLDRGRDPTRGIGSFGGEQTWACPSMPVVGLQRGLILRQKWAFLGRGVVHGNQHDED